MGTYVRYYCALRHQQILPGDVNGLSNKVQHVAERTDLGRLFAHLLGGFGDGPHWLTVCESNDGAAWEPTTGLPDYDTVREFEDVTEAAVASYNATWPESEPLLYRPPPHRQMKPEPRRIRRLSTNDQLAASKPKGRL